MKHNNLTGLILDQEETAQLERDGMRDYLEMIQNWDVLKEIARNAQP